MTNGLARERSPYLLQHAHNPVDWYPWGEEAFDRARREDKPVFLSIGYSACHWCHVMERESFEDPPTAAELNAHFVSIKVDREERPDIDQVYQLAYQLIAQRAGGWPLSMFLTPDRRPFYGGTYFPPAPRHGMPSFRELLHAVRTAYSSKRDDVNAQASELAAALAQVGELAGTRGAAPAAGGALARATTQLLARAAPRYGGFGRAPKFPNTMAVELLFMAAVQGGNAPARDHALATLDGMARGGIHDHLGGGFARYSTDERWLIPHFEKMLYDNGLLARLYLDGFRLLDARDTASPIDRDRCREVVADTLGYALREMTDPHTGTFYSAQDADSEGEEGRFFVWTPDDIARVVSAADAPLVSAYFGVTEEGNFEHGKSALWTPRDVPAVATELAVSADAVRAAVARARPALFAAREQRARPARDEKCLAAWNALLISALADAGATLAEPAWVAASERALEAWQTRAWDGARLAHAMKDGAAYGTGFLDDYAGLAGAALDVYEATFAPAHLAFARALLDAAIALFWDESARAFYFTPAGAEIVLHRPREVHDQAYPGGVGLVCNALLRAATLTGTVRYRDIADAQLAPLAAVAAENPLGLATVARAADRASRGSVEIVVLGTADDPLTGALCVAARSVYAPHRALVRVADEAEARAHGLDPALARGRSTGHAYVCRGAVCDAPVRTPEALVAAVRRAVSAPA